MKTIIALTLLFILLSSCSENTIPKNTSLVNTSKNQSSRLQEISVNYIKNIPEYQRNNGSNLRYIRSNPLPKNAWNVVYEYNVNTNLLPSFIKKQQVHLLVENGTVTKYIIAEASSNVVNK